MTRTKYMHYKVIVRILAVIFMISVLPSLGLSAIAEDPNEFHDHKHDHRPPTHTIDYSGQINVYLSVGFQEEPYLTLYNNPDKPYTFHFRVYDRAHPEEFLAFVQDPYRSNAWLYAGCPEYTEVVSRQATYKEVPFQQGGPVVLDGLPTGVTYEVVLLPERLMPYDMKKLEYTWWQLEPAYDLMISDFQPFEMPKNGVLEMEVLNNVTVHFLTATPGSTIRYDGNGFTGSVPPPVNNYAIGASVYVLGPADTWHPDFHWPMQRVGYTFTGWNTKPDGSGTTYHPTAPYWENALTSEQAWKTFIDAHLIMPRGNITLYAQWEPTGNVSPPKEVPTGTTAPPVATESKTDPTKTKDPNQPTVTPWEHSFIDISQTAWFYDDVAYAVQHGLMRGVSDTTFQPEDSLTRAMAVQVFYNLAGKPDVSHLPIPFTDVKQAWYTDPIKWAADVGVVSGVGDGKFAPDDKITREQIAQMIRNYETVFKLVPPDIRPTKHFDDAGTISAWAKEAVCVLTSQGIIDGMPGNCFVPHGYTRRSEFAKIFHKYMEAVA